MRRFIEVTLASTGEPVVLNPAAIERVHQNGAGSVITFVGGTEAGSPQRLKVTEPYDSLKRWLMDD